MSHELRTPLAANRGLVELYKMESDEKRKEQIINDIEEVSGALSGTVDNAVFHQGKQIMHSA